MPHLDLFAGPLSHLSDWVPQDWVIADDWRPVVDAFLASPAGKKLSHFMQERLANGALIFPPQPFLTLQLTSLAQVRVVILGQDPYHGPSQAQGLAFSVGPKVQLPPSLRNIFKEIDRDPKLNRSLPRASGDGSLISWARQGVLLLNTCLTVEAGQPASHAKKGWERLTDAIVRAVAAKSTPLVFMLWGAHAQAKANLILTADAASPKAASDRSLVLMANHPSPLSALRPPVPFLGCSHFSQANAFLRAHGVTPIHWD